MEQTKRPYYIALAVLLAVAILLSGALGGLLYKRSGNDKLVELSNDLHKSLTMGFTDIKIKDKNSALRAVDSVKEKLGIGDASKELKVSKVTKHGNDKYYRMQQYYDGLPVYGREVIVGADEDGTGQSLDTNYSPIGGELSTTPSTNQDTVNRNVKKALERETKAAYQSTTTVTRTTGKLPTEKTTRKTEAKTSEKSTEKPKEKSSAEAPSTTTSKTDLEIFIDELTDKALCICDMFTKGKPVLAYQLFVQTALETYTVLVNATTGDVIQLLPETREYRASCTSTEGAEFYASYNEEFGRYMLADEDQRFLTMTWNNLNSSWAEKAWYIDSEDNVFGNTSGEQSYEHEKGIKLFRNLQWIRNYYRESLGEAADDYAVAFYNDSVQNGMNAFATMRNDINCVDIPNGEPVGVISIGSQIPTSWFDVLAHEYTHRVDGSIVGLIYEGESGALAEAFADIMGELLEAQHGNTTPDWEMGKFRALSVPRRMDTDEANAALPSKYKGEHWVPTGSADDHGGVHTNGAVMSYATYLMWSGMKGTMTGIEGRSLMDLWLSAFHTFKRDETFRQAADSFYNVARVRCQRGDVSENQLETIEHAFAEVGLPVTDGGETDPVVLDTSKESEERALVKEVEDDFTMPGDTFDATHSNKATYKFDWEGKTVTVQGGDGVSNLLGLVNLDKLADMPCLMADSSEVYAQEATPYFYPKDYLFFYYSDYIREGRIKTVVFENAGTPWDWEVPDTHSTWKCTVEDSLLQEIEIDGFSRDNIDGTIYPYRKHIYYHYDENGRLEKVVFESGDITNQFEYDKNGNVIRCLVQGYAPELDTTELNIDTERNGYVTKRRWSEGTGTLDSFTYDGGKLSHINCPEIHWETVFRYSNGHLSELISRDSKDPSYSWTYIIRYQ